MGISIPNGTPPPLRLSLVIQISDGLRNFNPQRDATALATCLISVFRRTSSYFNPQRDATALATTVQDATETWRDYFNPQRDATALATSHCTYYLGSHSRNFNPQRDATALATAESTSRAA